MISISNMVPDAETAIKVGAALLEAFMGKERFQEVERKMPLTAQLHGDVWAVYSHTPPVEGDDGLVYATMGGGGPCIELSRQDARVLKLYFQR